MTECQTCGGTGRYGKNGDDFICRKCVMQGGDKVQTGYDDLLRLGEFNSEEKKK